MSNDGRHRLRIMLVEDDTILRHAFTMVLEEVLEHEVEAHGTVASTLERLDAIAFDVVLVDMRLPDGSGMDVAAAVRARRWRRRPKVIVLSGWPPSTDERVKVDGFLLKPAKEEDLRQLLDGIAATLDPPS